MSGSRVLGSLSGAPGGWDTPLVVTGRPSRRWMMAVAVVEAPRSVWASRCGVVVCGQVVLLPRRINKHYSPLPPPFSCCRRCHSSALSQVVAMPSSCMYPPSVGAWIHPPPATGIVVGPGCRRIRSCLPFPSLAPLRDDIHSLAAMQGPPKAVTSLLLVCLAASRHRFVMIHVLASWPGGGR